MFNRRHLIAAAVAGSLLATAGALAQTAPIVGISTVTTYSTDARITAVDSAARTVTFAFPNGATATHKVSASLADFNARRVGDMVSVGLENKLTFVLSGPNAPTPRDRSMNVTAAASMGQSAAGVSAGQTVANWWVTGVDPAAGTISLVNPAGGAVRTYSVTTPEGRGQLPRVKTGDSVTAIDTSVLVVSITPKA
jgi:hypothetical protein